MSRDVYGKSSESVATIDLFALTYVVARVLTSEGSDFGLDTRGVLCSFSERELFQIFSSSAHSWFSAQIHNALPALFGNMSPRPIGCFRRIEIWCRKKNIKLKLNWFIKCCEENYRWPHQWRGRVTARGMVALTEYIHLTGSYWIGRGKMKSALSMRLPAPPFSFLSRLF